MIEAYWMRWEFLSRKADAHLNYKTCRMKRCGRRWLQLRTR